MMPSYFFGGGNKMSSLKIAKHLHCLIKEIFTLMTSSLFYKVHQKQQERLYMTHTIFMMVKTALRWENRRAPSSTKRLHLQGPACHFCDHTGDGLKSCTTWDVRNPKNNGINYQPQLVSRISAINSIKGFN